MRQIQPNGWSCLPTAFAIALDVPVENIFNFLEHDGSEIIWPDEAEPYNRRGFHIHEMYAFCLENGYAVTPTAPLLMLHSKPTVEGFEIKNAHFQEYFTKYNGVLTGRTKFGMGHAVAVVDYQLIDPVSGHAPEDDVEYETFQLLNQITS